MKKSCIILVLIVILTLSLGACVFEEVQDEPMLDSITGNQVEDTSDDVIENQQEDTEDSQIDGILSPEAAKKLHAIYDNASTHAQTITSVHELAIITSITASLDEVDGPISVTPSTLNGEEITLITLGGTDEVEGQATGMKESQLASFGKSNDYLTAVLGLFGDGTIPKDKPILVTGISLGGMIAQQLLGQEDIVNNYEIKGIITFGSPVTLPLDRHGVKVVRFQDKHDIVPLSGEVTINYGKNKEIIKSLNRIERIEEESKYTSPIETHALSYIEDECWNKYDFMGDSASSNELVLKENMTFYPAPRLSK